jgi:hypothetical protein
VDEDGVEEGPINLTLPEYLPIKVVFRRPDGETSEITNGITIDSAIGGLISFTVDIGFLDRPGVWQAQAWAGSWAAAPIGFRVRPNL